MRKNFSIILIVVTLLTLLFFIWKTKENKEEETKNLIQCLVEADVLVYGSRYCLSCSELIEKLGGYDKIDPIYIECEENRDKCLGELKTGYVPEIQIKGEIYTGEETLNDIAKEVGCLIEL